MVYAPAAWTPTCVSKPESASYPKVTVYVLPDKIVPFNVLIALFAVVDASSAVGAGVGSVACPSTTFITLDGSSCPCVLLWVDITSSKLLTCEPLWRPHT